MALKIAGIEPVELGERKCMPRMDADKRLRLSQLKFKTKQDLTKSAEVIASCFPSDKDYAEEFLKNYAGPTDMQLVALYLQGGQKALDIYQSTYDRLMNEAIEKAQAKTEEKEQEPKDGDD